SSRPLIIYNLLGLGLAALALRAAPRDSGRRLIVLFCIAVGLMWLLTMLFFDFWSRTPISTVVARLQLPRAGWIVNLLGLLAITFGGLAAGWALYQALRRHGWSALRAAPALATGFLIAAAVQHIDEWLFYSAHKGGLKAAAEFQEWARTQTPLDSVFLLMPGEPNNQTFYKNAERTPFLVRQRAAQAIYFRDQSLAFESRVRALGVDQTLHYKEELDPA